MFRCLFPASKKKGPVPERPISANLGLKFCFTLILYLPSYTLPSVTFCVIISFFFFRSKGTTVLCKLELHVLTRNLQFGLILG